MRTGRRRSGLRPVGRGGQRIRHDGRDSQRIRPDGRGGQRIRTDGRGGQRIRTDGRGRGKRFPAVSVSPGFCLLSAWFGASGGWNVLAGILAAAAVHECGHLLALARYGVPVESLRLRLTGAVLDADCSRLSYGRELVCVLAGPAVNLLCAAVLSIGNRRPVLAGIHLALCLFNLLPIRPLDGGKAVYLAAAWCLGPDAGEMLATVCGAVTAAALSCAAGYVVLRSGGNLWLLPAAGEICLASFDPFPPALNHRR